MLRKIGLLGVAVVLAVAAGCTMCCHPYDNCGPVYDDSCGEPYCSNVRAGSILESGPARVAHDEAVEENAEAVSSNDRAPAAESEPRRLSAADRSAGEKNVAPAKSVRRSNKTRTSTTSSTRQR
jgi:hypothetical protein